MTSPAPRASIPHARWLRVLLVIFIIRVVAQPLALVLPAGVVPTFESWHSGAVPYPLLVAAQVLIIWWLARTAAQLSSGKQIAYRRRGVVMLTLGGLYFVTMVARLVLGATWLRDQHWFASPIPTVFHLVLAAAVLVYGHFHYRYGTTETTGPLVAWLHYPVVMVGAFGMFAALQAAGLSLVASTYIPIVTTALVVTLLEIAFPYRLDWRPAGGEVRTDLVFLAVVQLALPPLVSFFFIYMLVEPAKALDLPIAAVWPHQWPVWLQAVLMVLTVDFLRYWLHRWAHTNSTLWRLHAVHHSVEQLYWLNTSRFHPIEKGLQMALDSLPFLLMGVNERVLALYYVSYATNGFFQHCNIDLRYGALNYIVGSAETHRWHHSKQIHESNNNYGNTVIIWDVLFGTWFLPKDRAIAELGLLDAEYPKSFVGMLRAPFRRRTG